MSKEQFLQIIARPHYLVGLGPRLFFLLNLSLATHALIRAGDYAYLSQHQYSPGSLATIEMAAPLWLWALAMGIGGALILIGSFDPPRLKVMVAGHYLLAVVFFSLGVGVVWQYLTDNIPGGVRVGSAIIFCVAVVHFAFGLAVERRRKALNLLAERQGGVGGAC